MLHRLFHSLLASSVVAATAAVGSFGVSNWLPEGRTRDAVERVVVAPGQTLYEKVSRSQEQAKLPADLAKRLQSGQEGLQEAGLDMSDLKKLKDSPLGREILKATAKAREEAQRLIRLYNVGAWAGTGFLICFVMTLLFGVSSIKSALVLGFKVTLTLIFLQGALVLGGVLVYQKMAG